MTHPKVRRPYEKPLVKTIDARQLLESLGPVCGYALTDPGLRLIRDPSHRATIRTRP